MTTLRAEGRLLARARSNSSSPGRPRRQCKSPADTQPGREADNLPRRSPEVKNKRSDTCTPRLCLHGVRTEVQSSNKIHVLPELGAGWILNT
jgi:hypothetical protein